MRIASEYFTKIWVDPCATYYFGQFLFDFEVGHV